MNTIKYYLVRLAEKITGRKCSKCLYNVKGRCCHPDGRMFMRCWSSIRRPGFKYSEAVHFARTNGAAVVEGLQAGMAAPLTAEERRLLQKIQGTLDAAETNAREAGLLEG
jgi:hypothetical protein